MYDLPTINHPLPKTMTSRERVLGCLARTGYDRIPIKHEGTPEVNHALMKHFGLSNMEQLLVVLGEDFRYVAPNYQGPPLRTFADGSIEGYWGEHYIYGRGGVMQHRTFHDSIPPLLH